MDKKGYRWSKGALGDLRGVWGVGWLLGGIRGVGCVRGVLGLAGSVGTQGQKGYR